MKELIEKLNTIYAHPYLTIEGRNEMLEMELNKWRDAEVANYIKSVEQNGGAILQ